MKQENSLPIYGDYKVTVKHAANIDCFPLPCHNDLFTSLAGGKAFSNLDLVDAYHWLELDENSKDLVVINKHKGLIRYN